MACSVQGLLFDQSGEISISDEGRYEHNFEITYLVLSDDYRDGPLTAGSAFGIPALKSAYTYGTEFDTFAILTRIRAERFGTEESGLHRWKVICSYNSVNPDFHNTNPLENKPRVFWNGVKYEKIVEFDNEGNPVRNSAGLPFDPTLVRDQSRPQLRIEWETAQFNYPLSWQARDCVNEFEFAGADPGHVKVMSLSAQSDYSPEIGKFWHLSLELEFDPDGWQKQIYNTSYYELNDNDQLVPCLVGGDKAQTPQFIDLNGKQLQVPVEDEEIQDNKLEFDVYNKLDFGVFGLEELGLDLGLGEGN